MAELSIIIVNWNAKDYLDKCLRSLIADTKLIDAEIIVVDNASNDGSVEMIGNCFQQIRLIQNSDNLGFAKANNIGILNSSGKYVCLVNSDVLVLPNCLKPLINYLKKHNNVALIGPKILNVDSTLQRSAKKFPSILNTFFSSQGITRLFPSITFHDHGDLGEVDILSGCFWVLQRSALDKVGLLDEDFFFYAEDKDWCKRAYDAGWKVIYFPYSSAIHYGGVSSSNAPLHYYIEMQKSNLLYLKKHSGPITQTLLIIISIMHQLMRIIVHSLLMLSPLSDRDILKHKVKRSILAFKFNFKALFHAGI